MVIKVISTYGSIELALASEIEHLTRENRIAAYHVENKWVEIRRRQVTDPGYRGPERRKSHFVTR